MKLKRKITLIPILVVTFTYAVQVLATIAASDALMDVSNRPSFNGESSLCVLGMLTLAAVWVCSLYSLARCFFSA